MKMPEPTNTPSAPSCIMRAASAGVATDLGEAMVGINEDEIALLMAERGK